MNLTPYIKAAYPVLYLQTAEENRADEVILQTAVDNKRKLAVWTHTEGFQWVSEEDTDEETDPIDALKIILQRSLSGVKGQSSPHIYIFRDFHHFFRNPRVLRMVRDIAKSFRQTRNMLIFMSPVAEIPKELEKDITLLEFSLPGRDFIEKTFDKLYEANKKAIGKIDEGERERIIQAAMGLTTDEAEAAFAKALVERVTAKKNKEEVLPVSKLVLGEKAAAVKKTGILEYFPAKETVDDIGGLDNLKTWLTIRSKAFSQKARDFHLPMPRGILLVGLPGCGKSLSAKATSNILGVPLIRFDVGRVFGGLVGESESNLRTAIQTVEAVGNCVLWIDEMDKAFAGMAGGSTDGGTSQRVFGNFITWMQEKTAPIFIVATVNRIGGLPPELLRKGRFDEIFFVGLPTQEERRDILNIHIRRYGRDPSNFELDDCVEESSQFSGAELEEAVVGGLYSAFHHDRELETDDIFKAIRNTNPLANSNSTDLQQMAEWATKNAVNASSSKPTKSAAGSAGRQLDL